MVDDARIMSAQTFFVPEETSLKAKYIALIVLAVLVVILVLQNWYDVLIQLFFWNQEMPLAVFGILMAAIGFLLGLLTARVTRGESRKD